MLKSLYCEHNIKNENELKKFFEKKINHFRIEQKKNRKTSDIIYTTNLIAHLLHFNFKYS